MEKILEKAVFPEKITGKKRGLFSPKNFDFILLKNYKMSQFVTVTQ
jgi:hypothetical protein